MFTPGLAVQGWQDDKTGRRWCSSTTAPATTIDQIGEREMAQRMAQSCVQGREPQARYADVVLAVAASV
jgi:hypothetical protein